MKSIPTVTDLPGLGWHRTVTTEQYPESSGRHKESIRWWSNGKQELPEYLILTIESWHAGFWKGVRV